MANSRSDTNLRRVLESVGRYRRQVWNAAITNMLEESIAIAKSWTFGSGKIASMWEYKSSKNNEGLIDHIVIRNILPMTGRKDAQEIWNTLEVGRKSYVITSKKFMFLPIVNQFTGKFGVRTKSVLVHKREGLHPLERAKEHFDSRLAEFQLEIKAARWGNSAEQPTVKMIPNLYKTNSRSMEKYLKPLTKSLNYGSYLYKKDRPSERKSTKLMYKSFLRKKAKEK